MKPIRLFIPILAGATLRDRLLACLGALIGIGLTGVVSAVILGDGAHLPLIIAPIGASAVLIFAVPASPLAQPWSIIGGNMISALVGIAVAQFIDIPMLAIGVAVALAIAAMSFARCLHPPGGAVALMAVISGPAVTDLGYFFAFVPVALNSIILVALGIAFHAFSRRKYPHLPAAAPVNTHLTSDLPAQLRVGFNADDVDAALETIDETFDIDPGDLSRLLHQVERQALLRHHGDILAKHIMSRDVVRIDADGTADEARNLLLTHNIRTLPVVNAEGKLLGTVGLRELETIGVDGITTHMAQAQTTSADDPVVALVPVLTDGHAHAVIVTDENDLVLGLISQTDLLSALARALRLQQTPPPTKPKTRLHLLRGAGI